jgi:arginine exporter protein ArgO
MVHASVVLAAQPVLPALAAGVLAGLGVALPLGAVGVLLLQEGMLRGRRPALLGATAVATVDLAYAAAAVVAGGLVTALLAGREREVRLTAAVVLAGLALRGLAGTRTSTTRVGPPTAGAGAGAGAGTAYWRFLGLTALNPLTAVYFAVLAAGLGERVRSAPSATAFVLGVFAASLAWQTVLALVGTELGARLPAHARAWTSRLGYGVVLALAVALALSGS